MCGYFNLIDFSSWGNIKNALLKWQQICWQAFAWRVFGISHPLCCHWPLPMKSPTFPLFPPTAISHYIPNATHHQWMPVFQVPSLICYSFLLLVCASSWSPKPPRSHFHVRSNRSSVWRPAGRTVGFKRLYCLILSSRK